MKTRKSPIFLIILAFVFLILPDPAGALVNWTNRSATDLTLGAPTAWDSGDMGSPFVIKEGMTYKMWYGGMDDSTGAYYHIGYATSTDGTHWTKQGVVIHPDDVPWVGSTVLDVSMPCVINDGGTYKMWYTAVTADSLQIGYAESGDGISWTHHTAPVLPNGDVDNDWDGDGVSGAMVIKDGGTYKMWYTGYSENWPGNFLPGIGYATSSNGTTWAKYNNVGTTVAPFINSDPVIRLGPPSSWRGYNLGAPTVIKEDSYYRMWYAGDATVETASVDRIGFAYSKDGISWRDYDGNPVLHPGPAAFDGGAVNKPSVIKDGNTYKIWYAGYSSTNVPTIGYAESSTRDGRGLAFKAGVTTVNTPGGMRIMPLCTVPWLFPLDVTQLDVTGPNGFYYLFGDSDIQSVMGLPYISVSPSSSINSGTYTFTLKANNGETVTQSLNLTAATIPVPGEGTSALDRSVNDDKTQPPSGFYAGTTAPTFKWKPYLGDSYYYRVRVLNWERAARSAIWYWSDFAPGSTKGGDGYMSVTVPAGILKDNTPYQWQVEVADTSDIWSAHNRSQSGYYYFYTGTKGTSNFLSSDTNFVSMRSSRDGDTAHFWAVVQNLAPWDINTTTEPFRVKKEDGSPFAPFTVDPNSFYNNAFSSDPLPFVFSAYIYGTPVNATSPGYEFYIKDSVSGNSSSIIRTFQDVTVPTALGLYSNCTDPCTQPILYWQSAGPAYKHRVRIADWNFRRLTYQSSWFDGAAQGAGMSVQVPAGALKESTPYHWWVEVTDNTISMNSYTRSQYQSLMTYGGGPLLYGNFGAGAGIWQWNGDSSGWSQVTPNNPQSMVASGSSLYGNFGTGAGIWKWDGTTWSQVTPNSPTDMVASGSLLYGNFGTGAGIWQWNGTAWSQITPNAPIAMAASGPVLYGNFGPGAGIWKWDGSAWSQVTPNAPTAMAVSGSLLYGNFGPGAGIWKWDGSAWSQVTPNAPIDMLAEGSLLYGNFGTGAGIWKWDGSAWSQLTPNAPTAMVAVGSILCGNFGPGAGIWQWLGTTWSQMTPNSPTSMVVGF
jgi:predicted GH43/DUF377 family glycosyl hydrolase